MPVAPPPTAAATPAQQPPAQPQSPRNAAEHPKANVVVPIAVAGTGLALFIVGGLVYLDGAKKVKDYESPEKCGPTHKQCPSDMVDAANSAAKQETTGGVIALVGLPVMAGGIIWYFVASSSAKSARVTPAVGPGFAGLSLDGQF